MDMHKQKCSMWDPAKISVLGHLTTRWSRCDRLKMAWKSRDAQDKKKNMPLLHVISWMTKKGWEIKNFKLQDVVK